MHSGYFLKKKKLNAFTHYMKLNYTDIKALLVPTIRIQSNLALVNFWEAQNVYYCQVFTIYHVIYAMIANFGEQQKVY